MSWLAYESLRRVSAFLCSTHRPRLPASHPQKNSLPLYLSSSLLALLFHANTLTAAPYKTIEFPSLDGLRLTADLYHDGDASKPFILLFHQARYSRGEYIPIAPKLTALGFNALAVDQRSGRGVRGVRNQTAERAVAQNRGTDYLDAEQDMRAAMAYVRDQKLAAGKVILWGSSYSASLVLKMAGEGGRFDGVVAFSPGEYFQWKDPDFIKAHAVNIKIPVWITCTRSESAEVRSIVKVIPGDAVLWLPATSAGVHGSKALWESGVAREETWTALTAFLERFK